MFSNGRGFVIVMLFLAGVINYLDRSALLSSSFYSGRFEHTSGADGHCCSAVFSIGYAIFNFIGGWASDKYGAKHTLSAAMVVWSVFSGAIALTYNFVSLFIIRVIFGMGEGPLSAATSKSVNNWFPQKERARALGHDDVRTPLGGAISGPIVGLIAIHWGWKASFVLIMIIGLIWTWFWMKFMKDKPDDSRSLSPEKEARPKKDTGIPLSFYLKQPTVLFTAFAFFSYNYILFFFLTWFPSYLTSARGLSILDMSVANDDTVGCRISRSRTWGIYIGLSVQADGQTDVFEKSRACVLPFGCGGMHWICRACHDCVWSCCPCRTIGFLFVFDRHHILGDYTGYRSSGQGRGCERIHALSCQYVRYYRSDRYRVHRRVYRGFHKRFFACGRAGGGRFYLRRFVCETDTF
jgi:MFS family permease